MTEKERQVPLKYLSIVNFLIFNAKSTGRLLSSSDTLYNVNVRLNHIVGHRQFIRFVVGGVVVASFYNIFVALLIRQYSVFQCMQPRICNTWALFVSRVFYARHFLLLQLLLLLLFVRQLIRSVSALCMLKLTYFHSILPLYIYGNTHSHTLHSRSRCRTHYSGILSA